MYVETHPTFFEEANDAGGGIQAESGSARKQDRVNLLDEVHRPERIRLARSGCAAALIDPSNSPPLAQDHGAARQGLAVIGMSDLDTRDVGDRILTRHPTSRLNGSRYRSSPSVWSIGLR
jgi:hypothetical protein